jgi:glycosyltransferase involved in cell wall biosynthesis
MKVLWVSHFVPYPPKGGAFQRSYNLIRRVGEIHDLHLLALRHKSGTHPAEETERAEHELGRHCVSVQIVDGTKATSAMWLAKGALRLVTGKPLTVSASDITAMHAMVRKKVASCEFDLVHFDTIGLACYLRDIGHAATVLNHHGAESFMMSRRTARERNLLKRILFWTEGRALRRYEARYCPRFRCNLTVSELDAKLLSDIAPDARFRIVPNGTDVDYFFRMTPVANRHVIFAGRLDQYSNRDAMLHFCMEVWPLVRERFPGATLEVIGSNPPKELVALSRRDPTIRVRGFVDDLRPYFAAAAVAVCPIRDGGGTRVKILDDLAMGKPTVSTTIGIEGIDVVPERDLLVADSPEEFVAQLTRIFDDQALAARLSENARRVAENVYSWDVVASSLLDAYRCAAEQSTVRSTMSR